MIDLATEERHQIENHGFPTILVAGNDGSFATLANAAKLDGYLVLEASSPEDALVLAKVNPRAIHVLLADQSVNGSALGETLKPYRPEMRLLMVNGRPQDTLAEVRRLFKLEPISTEEAYNMKAGSSALAAVT